MKRQKLPYFEATSWTPMNMQEIFHRNSTANKKYRPDLLPTINHPGKPSDETLNTRENFEAYDMAGFQADPPTYQFATYDEETVIMSQDDFLRFMTRAYTRLRLGQFMHGGRLLFCRRRRADARAHQGPTPRCLCTGGVSVEGVPDLTRLLFRLSQHLCPHDAEVPRFPVETVALGPRPPAAVSAIGQRDWC